MKRGRTVKQESYSDAKFIGQRLTEEEKAFHKKYIDYKQFKFPEINPIDMKVKKGSREYKLATFRYPAQTHDRKGIIFFNNGYGDYCARYAHIAQHFAEAGYDFMCFDPLNFG